MGVETEIIIQLEALFQQMNMNGGFRMLAWSRKGRITDQAAESDVVAGRGVAGRGGSGEDGRVVSSTDTVNVVNISIAISLSLGTTSSMCVDYRPGSVLS